MPTDSIRSFPVKNSTWKGWLANFPTLPRERFGGIDKYLNDIGPYLANRPNPDLLEDDEKRELTIRFARYALALSSESRKRNITTLIDGGILSASGVGWWAGVTFLGPVTVTASVLAIARETWNTRKWNQKKDELDAWALFMTSLAQNGS